MLWRIGVRCGGVAWWLGWLRRSTAVVGRRSWQAFGDDAFAADVTKQVSNMDLKGNHWRSWTGGAWRFTRWERCPLMACSYSCTAWLSFKASRDNDNPHMTGFLWTLQRKEALPISNRVLLSSKKTSWFMGFTVLLSLVTFYGWVVNSRKLTE